MTEHEIPAGEYVPMQKQGDPEKMAYLRDAGWKGKTRVGTRPLQIDPRICPGCVFGGAKWPHNCGKAAV